MKTGKTMKQIPRIFAALLAAALLAGCLPVVGPLPEKAETPVGAGRVVIRLGGGASRSVTTDFTAIDKSSWSVYCLKLLHEGDSPDTGTPVWQADIPVENGIDVDIKDVTSGTYTLYSAALSADGAVYAEGYQSFTVTAGQTETVRIVLYPVMENTNGEGTFAAEVEIPLDKASGLIDLSLVMWYNNAPALEVHLDDFTWVDDGAFRRYTLDEQSLPAGHYTLKELKATVPSGNTYYPAHEEIPIYEGLTTTFKGTLFWTGEYKTLSGTVLLDSPAERVMVRAYSDAALSQELGVDRWVGETLVPVEGGKQSGRWEMLVPKNQGAVYFGVTTGTEANPDANDLGDFGYLQNTPAAGRTDIALPLTAVYTVAFNSGGGEPKPQPQNVVQGGKAAEPAGMTKEYYDLEGWYREAAMINKWDFAAHTVTGNITLYARWTPHLYNVTFDSAGGSFVETQHIAYNGLAAEPSGVTKTGYLLEGWYWSMDGLEIKWDFAALPVWFDLVLYAKWTPRYYKVDFETNGGSPAPASQNIAYNQHAAAPPEITKPGFVFDRWYEDQDCTRPWNFAVNVITGPTTLYAGWNQSGGVSWGFSGPKNEDIVLGGDQVISWRANTPITFTVNDSFTAIRWYIDGTLAAGETGASLTRLASDFTVAAHHVTADVQIGGLWYSKTVTFTVVAQ
jgi:uncharacterized repeat protein (TIGR02543 family)